MSEWRRCGRYLLCSTFPWDKTLCIWGKLYETDILMRDRNPPSNKEDILAHKTFWWEVNYSLRHQASSLSTENKQLKGFRKSLELIRFTRLFHPQAQHFTVLPRRDSDQLSCLEETDHPTHLDEKDVTEVPMYSSDQQNFLAELNRPVKLPGRGSEQPGNDAHQPVEIPAGCAP